MDGLGCTGVSQRQRQASDTALCSVGVLVSTAVIDCHASYSSGRKGGVLIEGTSAGWKPLKMHVEFECCEVRVVCVRAARGHLGQLQRQLLWVDGWVVGCAQPHATASLVSRRNAAELRCFALRSDAAQVWGCFLSPPSLYYSSPAPGGKAASSCSGTRACCTADRLGCPLPASKASAASTPVQPREGRRRPAA